MRVDVHQHLWTEPLFAALARRRRPPRLSRLDRLGWLLHLEGEPRHHVDGPDDIPARTAELADDRVDLALVALSCALGVESLPPDEGAQLIAAYEVGVAELPGGWRAWGAVSLAEPDPGQVDRLLDAGFVGLCLPARALATPAGLDRCGPLLERLERRDAPLFLHPGGAPDADGGLGPGAPAWWPALTSYVAEMNAAWHTFVARGRHRHPALRVLFAMLAGGAPLHGERLAARGGPLRAGRDDTFLYDTSSYGPSALTAVARAVGFARLVYGSDRPVVRPPRRLLGSAADQALREAGAERLLCHWELAA